MSNLFPYADVSADSIAAVFNVASEFTNTEEPPIGLGFTLIDDTLVPNTFLDDVDAALSPIRLNCFEVTRVADLFDEAFLASLTVLEREVLGGCVMLLLEKGLVPISLIDRRKTA